MPRYTAAVSPVLFYKFHVSMSSRYGMSLYENDLVYVILSQNMQLNDT